MRSSASFAWDRLRPEGAERRVSPVYAAHVVLGGWTWVGWLFIAVGSLFVWIFDAPRALLDVRQAISITRPAMHAGVVQIEKVESTAMNVNKTNVRRVHFTYDSAGGQKHGVAFHTGVDERAQPGETMPARIADDGSFAIPDGWRRSEVGAFIVGLFLFPLAGVLSVIRTLIGNARKLSLLRRGTLTTGKLTGRTPTNMRVNKQTVYRYTFRFLARDHSVHEAIVKTHDATCIRDEADEPLLYDPVDPERSVLLGDVPGNPRIDDDGGFSPSPNTAAAFLAVLLLPVFAVLVNVVGWLVRSS